VDVTALHARPSVLYVPVEPCFLPAAVSSKVTLCCLPEHERVPLLMLVVTSLENT